MKNNELVWRELVDSAVARDVRRWDNVADLAFRAGVASSTAAYALRKPIEIGAVRQHHAGFTVINPDKVLTLCCAARSIAADALHVTDLPHEVVRHLVSEEHPLAPHLIRGGCEAAVALLGGVNTVSDFSDHVIYLRDENVRDLVLDEVKNAYLDERRREARATFLVADKRARRTWKRHSSFAQTYADLFATPGWQSSEFRLALQERFLRRRDWDQE